MNNVPDGSGFCVIDSFISGRESFLVCYDLLLYLSLIRTVFDPGVYIFVSVGNTVFCYRCRQRYEEWVLGVSQ